MSYFQYQDKQVYYTEMGEGPALLLLHGNTASSNMFYEIADLYAKHYHVIQIDFLGHGQSARLPSLPADLWFFEAEQVIAFLKAKQLGPVHIIGTSGGALVAINVALEARELVDKVVADSFEGEFPIKSYVAGIIEERAASKQDAQARMFYEYMHGDGWELIVDQDTDAIVRHEKEIGCFFHQELTTLACDILLTGSKEDEFVQAISADYFETVYSELLHKIGHDSYHLFPKGGHPAMLSNPDEFFQISTAFLEGKWK